MTRTAGAPRWRRRRRGEDETEWPLPQIPQRKGNGPDWLYYFPVRLIGRTPAVTSEAIQVRTLAGEPR
jgi:hypothetical protein